MDFDSNICFGKLKKIEENLKDKLYGRISLYIKKNASSFFSELKICFYYLIIFVYIKWHALIYVGKY